MTEQDIISELQTVLCDLTGDILVLECLYCCEDYVERVGLSAALVLLQRIKDYFEQNIAEVAKFESLLVKAIHQKILLSAQTGQI